MLTKDLEALASLLARRFNKPLEFCTAELYRQREVFSRKYDMPEENVVFFVSRLVLVPLGGKDSLTS